MSVTGNIAVSGTVDGVDVAALSSTVSTKLNNLVEDTTPQLGGNLDCNNKVVTLNDSSADSNNRIKIGNAGDLQIYHDGTNSFITNTTGSLKVREDNIDFQNSAGTENLAKFIANGSAELYYDNSKKLYTDASGVTIGGPGYERLKIDGQVGDCILSSSGAEIEFTRNSENNISCTGGSGSVLKLNVNSKLAARFAADAQAELYHNNNKKLETTSSGVDVNGNCTITGNFRGNDNVKLNLGNGDDLQIYHDGSTSHIQDNVSNTLRISADSIALQSGDKSEAGVVFTKNGTVQLYYDNSHKAATTSNGLTIQGNSDLRFISGTWTGESTTGMKIQAHGNSGYFQFQDTLHFRNTSGINEFLMDQSGNFTAGGNVTAYSDRRLKTDIHTINDALGICGKLRGVSYKWIKDGKPSIGVIAQEVEEILPEVVLTNINTDPATGKTTEVKSVDYGKIVGVLINAINELKEELEIHKAECAKHHGGQ